MFMLQLRLSVIAVSVYPDVVEVFCTVADPTRQEMKSKSNSSSEEPKALWLKSKKR